MNFQDKMQGMDHSKMGHAMQDTVAKVQETMSGMDHSKMDHSQMDMSAVKDTVSSAMDGGLGMDHSMMDHSQMDYSMMDMTGMDMSSGAHLMAGIPDWLYYWSIVIIMLGSFIFLEISNKRGAGILNPLKFELTKFSFFKKLIVSRAVQFSIQLLMVGLFGLILYAGFYGNQQSGENIAPILTWNIWWVGLIFLILFFGKVWCYACPWDAVTSWMRRLSIFKIKNDEPFNLGIKWPKSLKNIYPAALLFIFLTWLEIGYNVTMSPNKTAVLGLAMMGMVFVPGLIFEKKSFCRYGCLIGRVSGLYAMFSPVEIRSKDDSVCATCKTVDCYRGNENGYECPTGQNLKTMKSNTYCTMCAECFRTCPSDNVALNLRPFGTDLAATPKPRKDEAYLALVLFSLTAFHGLTMTPVWDILIQNLKDAMGIGDLAAFSVGMTACLVVPVIVYNGFVWVSKLMSGDKVIEMRDLFIKYAYGLVPIALFYHLAHNTEHFIVESQKLVVLMSDPFGYGWNIFGTASMVTGALFSMSTIWYIQVGLIFIGHIFGIYISHVHSYKIFPDRKTAIKSQIPMILLMILFSVLSLWLVAQPMEMRTGM